MLTYQVYKVMHFAAIFLFLTGAAVLLLSSTKGRVWKIVTGISSFFVLFAGMGLVARLGNKWEGWMYGKVALWLVITGLGHLVARRWPARGMQAYWLTILLATGAAWLAVYKPF